VGLRVVNLSLKCLIGRRYSGSFREQWRGYLIDKRLGYIANSRFYRGK
jgi:hypothetical protein